MRRALTAAAAAGTLLLSGCGGDGGSEQAAPATVTATVTVTADPPSSSPSASSSSAAAQTAGVGATVGFEQYGDAGTITLHGVRRISQAEGPIGGTPTNGGYVVIDVTVSATAGTVTPNPLAFRAVGPDNRTYDSELGVLEQQMDSSEVPAGRSVRGEVAFDAPPGELLIDYGISGPLATFTVST
jgi:hypothetical protein